MTRPGDAPCVVLFDGLCHFCDRFVLFLIRHRRAGSCYFVPSQSEAGAEVMGRFQITEEAVEASLQVIAGGRVMSGAEAVLAAMERMTLPWSLAVLARVVPERGREGLYRLFSANRYRWFGRRKECRVPSAEERESILQTRAEVTRVLERGRPE